eukprot:CAMPEP_0177618362 /NCGR_PEP_ID=MMETSP0419_2-20121207/25527_1 /TAXON_ID=582737 /ORGANISM="Tetraselmis sp., Strain GSL018" /LENGTH=170 /DNA_ID=CAMNT_0019117239 /DNA_START=428 /DNA_END=937 /DNA_ORIENTATION=+
MLQRPEEERPPRRDKVQRRCHHWRCSESAVRPPNLGGLWREPVRLMEELLLAQPSREAAHQGPVHDHKLGEAAVRARHHDRVPQGMGVQEVRTGDPILSEDDVGAEARHGLSNAPANEAARGCIDPDPEQGEPLPELEAHEGCHARAEAVPRDDEAPPGGHGAPRLPLRA